MEQWLNLHGMFGKVLVASALCVDACSITVVLGLTREKTKNILSFLIMIATFHALLPLVGAKVGAWSGLLFGWYAPVVSAMLLTLLGLQMLWNAWKAEFDGFLLGGWLKRLLAAFLVSIDALTVGFSLGTTASFGWEDAMWFGAAAFLWPFVTWVLGRAVSNATGRLGSVLGGLVMLGFGIKEILKWV